MNLETKLLSAFVSRHPPQAARALESMDMASAADVLVALPVSASAELLPRLAPLFAAKCLERVGKREAALVVSTTRRSAAAPILRAMDSTVRASVLASLDPEALKGLKPLLGYSEGTAGALMDPEVLSVAQSATVAETLDQMRKSAQHMLYYVYVVDDDQKLVGVINVRELLGAQPERLVGLEAVRPVEAVPARASAESVIAHPGWRRFHALPVVGSDGRLLGVIRYKVVRELEHGFRDEALGDRGAETANAIGELFGLGLRGLLEWGASAVLGSTEFRRTRP